jgi:hypothetical protein
VGAASEFFPAALGRGLGVARGAALAAAALAFTGCIVGGIAFQALAPAGAGAASPWDAGAGCGVAGAVLAAAAVAATRAMQGLSNLGRFKA